MHMYTREMEIIHIRSMRCVSRSCIATRWGGRGGLVSCNEIPHANLVWRGFGRRIVNCRVIIVLRRGFTFYESELYRVSM